MTEAPKEQQNLGETFKQLSFGDRIQLFRSARDGKVAAGMNPDNFAYASSQWHKGLTTGERAFLNDFLDNHKNLPSMKASLQKRLAELGPQPKNGGKKMFQSQASRMQEDGDAYERDILTQELSVLELELHKLPIGQSNDEKNDILHDRVVEALTLPEPIIDTTPMKVEANEPPTITVEQPVPDSELIIITAPVVEENPAEELPSGNDPAEPVVIEIAPVMVPEVITPLKYVEAYEEQEVGDSRSIEQQESELIHELITKGIIQVHTSIPPQFARNAGFDVIYDSKLQNKSVSSPLDVIAHLDQMRGGQIGDVSEFVRFDHQATVLEQKNIREIKPASGIGGFFGKKKMVNRMESVKRGVNMGDIFSGGTSEPVSRLLYTVKNISGDGGYKDYSGRDGNILNVELFFPQSIAKKVEAMIHARPSFMRRLAEQVVFSRTNFTKGAWEHGEGVGGIPMRPPYEMWDAKNGGPAVYVIPESTYKFVAENVIREGA